MMMMTALLPHSQRRNLIHEKVGSSTSWHSTNSCLALKSLWLQFKAFSQTRTFWILVAWFAVWWIFIRLEFGAVYFLVSCFVGVFINLGRRRMVCRTTTPPPQQTRGSHKSLGLVHLGAVTVWVPDWCLRLALSSEHYMNHTLFVVGITLGQYTSR